MSLISCPECGREVSDTGKKCPHCGFVLKKVEAKKVFMVIALVLQLAVIVLSLIPSTWIYYKSFWKLDDSDGFSAIASRLYPTNVLGINFYGEFQASFIFSLVFIVLCLATVVFICCKVWGKNATNPFVEKFSLMKELWLMPLVAHIFQIASAISFKELIVPINLSSKYLTNNAGDLGDGVEVWMILQVLVILTVTAVNFTAIKNSVKTLFKKEKVEPIEMEGEEETELAVEKKKVNINKRYIIEFVVIMLLLVVPFGINAAIANIPREVVIEESDKEITTTKMWEIARQKAVNACCENTKVDTIKGFEIGSKSIREETDEYWEVEMSGSFYPIDKYGDFGDYHLFDVVVQVGKDGTWVDTTYDYVRKKRW